ncbi:hypothetical protein HMPREF0653_02461 [Prevotella disiens JCM 6334 = ATCC 29426]|uniref:Uncharacterized protein n=1 Tax=Prevotella disiens JCM 6334 = ATCC 29426 TaxID=1235811 RepID=A0ABP2Y8E0_9BACT|nr:hypothetical protein HMPREF0653_02461 [Prevotella disiens JCM 6334 = ATCC 29426]
MACKQQFIQSTKQKSSTIVGLFCCLSPPLKTRKHTKKMENTPHNFANSKLSRNFA